MLSDLNLLSWDLDLDGQWVTEQEFDRIPGELFRNWESGRSRKLDWRTFLAWFSPLMRATVESQATALHLLADHEAACLRQLVFVPLDRAGAQHVWKELIPMPRMMLHDGMRLVRLVAFMMPWGRRGTIRYLYQGTWRKATCVQESPDDLVIYLGPNRPTTRRLTDVMTAI